MAGPNKKELGQAGKDLAKAKTPKTQKSEASETLNYGKASKKKK